MKAFASSQIFRGRSVPILVPVLHDFSVMSFPCHMAAAECWLSFCSPFGAPLAGHVVVSGFCAEFLFHCARVYGAVVSSWLSWATSALEPLFSVGLALYASGSKLVL